jgi:hypothetical protein
MITIPLPTEVAGSFTQRTRLDGVDYSLRFTHNTRSDSWTLDVAALGGSERDNVPIATGVKIFIGNDLLRYASHPDLTPPGNLLALSADGSRRAPTRDELGTRVRLYYVEDGESL